jgi:hypothetical protein
MEDESLCIVRHNLQKRALCSWRKRLGHHPSVRKLTPELSQLTNNVSHSLVLLAARNGVGCAPKEPLYLHLSLPLFGATWHPQWGKNYLLLLLLLVIIIIAFEPALLGVVSVDLGAARHPIRVRLADTSCVIKLMSASLTGPAAASTEGSETDLM